MTSKGILNPKGWEQARATGKALRERYGVFDYIYHSGMHRVHETTEVILEAYTSDERARMPLSHNLRIRERDPGYTYGMTAEEAGAAFPWLQRHFEVVGKFFQRLCLAVAFLGTKFRNPIPFLNFQTRKTALFTGLLFYK